MNHNSFEVIQCPLNPLPIRALASSLANPIQKKNWSNPTPSYESVQKTIKDSKKKHGKSKNTTDNYDGNVHRRKEFTAAFVKDSLEKTKGMTQMETVPWTPTSIKPSLVHQLNVRLLLLPCS